MSHDEIVFGDVSYREPERRRRPDRDRRWACLAYEVPAPVDLPIFLDRATADAIERHALRDTSVELGGILLGKECVDDETGEPFVWVTRALEAKHYENTQASFTYTHDSWEEISRERDRLHPELDVVGWYHTHPNFGVFLSGHDLFIHEHFFAQPLQVAYVVDPIRQSRGFFQWRDGTVAELGGFYLIAERGDRIGLARSVNDLEGLPNAGGVGGALSPVLEAELIAMLTRPHPSVSGPADRAQAAATFGLLGALAGGLGLALLLWLFNLGHQIQSQGESLEDLKKAVVQVSKEQQERETDAARISGKEAALDALLGEVRLGGSKEGVMKVAERLAAERDEARREARRQGAVFAQFGNELARLQDGAKVQKEKLDDLKKTKNELEAEREALKKEIGARDAQLKDLQESKAGGLAARYRWAWNAAVAGWAVGLALGLALIASHVRRLPDGPEDPPAPEGGPAHPTS